MKAGLKRYKELHPFLNTIPPFEIHNIAQVKKYLPGQSYLTEHCENVSKQNRDRLLVWMFYLNDVTKGGGGTLFPQQNLTLEAREGDLYIWPAGWTHSHKGEPAKYEDKYILTGWFVFPRDSNQDKK